MELAKILVSLASLVVSIIALTVAFQARRDARKGFNAQHVPKVDFSMVNEKHGPDDKAPHHLHLHCTNKSNVDTYNQPC